MDEYLRRLGIDRFVPRRALPGAGRHALYRRGESKTAPPEPASSSVSLASSLTSASPREGEAASANAEMRSQPVSKVASVALSALRCGDLLLVDEVPYEMEEFGDDYRAMLGDVLLACGADAEVARAAMDKVLLLRYPSKTIRHRAMNEAEAADYIKAGFAGHDWGTKEAPARAALLGAAAARFAPSIDNARCAQCASHLHDLLRAPDLKREFQKQLLPIMEGA